MALFKIEKGLAADLITNRPDATEGYCYFTTDDGLFYIDTVSGTLTGDNPTGTRVLLNAGQAAYASRALKDYAGNIITETYATKEELSSTGFVPVFHSDTITGDGETFDFIVTHNLALYDVIVQVYDASTNQTVQCDIERPSINTVKISFSQPPVMNYSYRVLIYGLDTRLVTGTEYQDVIPVSEKGAANGVAPLNASGKIDPIYLPPLTSYFNYTLTGDGNSTLFTITHELGTRDVMVQVYDLDDYESVNCGIIRDTTYSINLRFNTAPASTKSYRVLIQALTSS